MYIGKNALYGLCKARGWSAARPNFQKSKDALDGWAAKLPPTARLPPPIDAVFLLVQHLAAGSLLQALVALAILVQFDMYLRPGELLALEVSHIVGNRRIFGRADTGRQEVAVIIAPLGHDEARPAKNRDFDCTVMPGTDCPVRRMIPGILLALQARSRSLSSPLLFAPLTLPLYEKILREAALAVGVHDLISVPHQLRHGGPSHDALRSFRDLRSIQARGRWRASSSVRIYEKHGSLLRQTAKLTRRQRDEAAKLDDRAVLALLRRVASVAHPIKK